MTSRAEVTSNLPFRVAIPARYGSSRLAGKPLIPIGGIPMILHVARRALAAGAVEVVIATDDERIMRVAEDAGVIVAMTRTDHASGSDRLAECAAALGWQDDDIVVNLQGDEPLAPVSGIRAVAAVLTDAEAPMATLATPLLDVHELHDPNCVKVLRDTQDRALYFSRAPVPWPRDGFAQRSDQLPPGVPFLRHIGVYAYRVGFLRRFTQWAPTPLERAESLEQLRALEHGYPIAVGLAPEPFPAGVDTADDLARVEKLLAGMKAFPVRAEE